MSRFLLLAVASLMALGASGRLAVAQTVQQTLVDRATLAVQEMLSDPDASSARDMMTKAKGAMICPSLFKAGFILGGQGGDCVLIGRGSGGGWSSPAFYGMGSGSVGFQIGLQDSEVLFIVLTDNGLRALLDSQFKIGGDASVAFATMGGGVQGATTTAMRADIVAFGKSRGLFAGLALEGSVISQRSDWNQAYYGRMTDSHALVLNNEGQNPGAEPLKEMLARYSSAAPAAPPPSQGYAPQSGYGSPPQNYAPAPQGYAPAYPAQRGGGSSGYSSGGSVQSAPLPPPR